MELVVKGFIAAWETLHRCQGAGGGYCLQHSKQAIPELH